MPQSPPNLRKAAVFIRSLDSETASTLLAQLSPGEAQALRAAIRSIGPLDPEEQADVLAEFRSSRPLATETASDGVELKLSTVGANTPPCEPVSTQSSVVAAKRFEFLERAPIDALVPYLAREHAQTIAVVLSHLPPRRAADVLAGLPDKLQADTVERLAALGETDPESVVVLEKELAAWLASRTQGISADLQATNAAASILAATDALTRSEIVKNLRTRNAALANRFEPSITSRSEGRPRTAEVSAQAAACADRLARGVPASTYKRVSSPSSSPPYPRTSPPRPQRLPHFPFDDLIRLDNRELAAVLSEVDSNVLVLALAGSTDALVDRVCRQMSSRTARSFRRLLRKLGPTRLSDVESAQRAVAEVAARRLAAGQANEIATTLA
jgi:flagellar motor switch protein FliG